MKEGEHIHSDLFINIIYWLKHYKVSSFSYSWFVCLTFLIFQCYWQMILVHSIVATCSHTMTSFDRHAIRAICGIEKSKALSVVFGSLAYFRELIADAAKKLAGWDSCNQEKIGGQRGSLPVQAFGYSNSTKVIYRWALERKSVFRNVGVNANLSCCKRLLSLGGMVHDISFIS